MPIKLINWLINFCRADYRLYVSNLATQLWHLGLIQQFIEGDICKSYYRVGPVKEEWPDMLQKKCQAYIVFTINHIHLLYDIGRNIGLNIRWDQTWYVTSATTNLGTKKRQTGNKPVHKKWGLGTNTSTKLGCQLKVQWWWNSVCG